MSARIVSHVWSDAAKASYRTSDIGVMTKIGAKSHKRATEGGIIRKFVGTFKYRLGIDATRRVLYDDLATISHFHPQEYHQVT